MSSKKIAVVLIALVASIALLTFAPAPWAPVAEAIPACSDSSLNGTFSFRTHGTNPDGFPFGSIGVFTSDGAGTITGSTVTADNGERDTHDFTCPYTMTPACTFSADCVDVGEVVPEVRWDGALDDGKKEVQILLTGIPDAVGGAVVSGVARKQ
jgi:hypothetical protein